MTGSTDAAHAAVSSKSRLVAFLLSFFLGGFGAHRFYVGRTGSGIVMAVLTCTIIGILVTAVWNLVDWIRILAGTFTDAEGRVITKWTD